MKRFRRIPIVAILIAAAALAIWPKHIPAQQAGKLTAEQILDKALSAYDGIKSHKYTLYSEGMDTFTKDQQKDMTGHYDNFAKKAGVENKVEDQPKLTRGKYDIKYMKPYLQQMLVIKSDFTPKIVWNTLITYRSDKDQDVWWAKPKIFPIAIKRSVEKDAAGGALTSNWTVTLLYMQYYKNNADLSLQPDREFDGRQCYVIRYTFDWKKRPKWDHKQPPIDKYGVPGPIKDIIWKDMLNIEKQKNSHNDYYIDKENFRLLNTEEYIEGKFHWRNSFKNIEVNTLTEKDF